MFRLLFIKHCSKKKSMLLAVAQRRGEKRIKCQPETYGKCIT
jgi:hypothetical protein